MKSILSLLVAVTISVWIIGCNETPSPVTQQSNVEITDAGTGNLNPFFFYGFGSTYPKKCSLNTRLELWAGSGNPVSATLVGYLEFLDVTATSMTVKYAFNDVDLNGINDMFPWVVQSIHFDIGNALSDIPVNKSGNPVPGQFDYNIELDSPWTQTIVTFPVTLPPDPEGDGYFVAAHAAACYLGGIAGFNFYLPNNPVTLRVIDYPSAGDPTYFKLQVTNGGFISQYNGGYGPGIYGGWCIDIDHTIGLNTNYNAYLYSSYENLPSWMIGPGKIEFPQNLDKVNWLINNFQSGQTVQLLNSNCTPYLVGGLPVYQALTYSDIQRAIWHYMDDNQSTSGLTNWSQQRVNAIICATDASGEGFVPGCNQKVVFLIVPTGTPGSFNVQIVIGQPVIGEFQVPCETQCETAWGDGKYGAMFPGAKQWGTYFRWDETWCPVAP